MTSTSDPSSTWAEPLDQVVEGLHRKEWGRLLALLVARTRRLDLAEDALAEAFTGAVDRWAVDGIPANPPAWLYTAAHRRILSRLRHEVVARRTAPLLAVGHGWTPPPEVTDDLPDDRLQLVLLCCHPALPAPARSALALRLVLGTPTEQIARLFLVPRATMAARITRAKKKIVLAGIPLARPAAAELHGRLEEVCRTVYLAYTAGYRPGEVPDPLRIELAGEAVRLAGILAEVAGHAPQVQALRALLVLQHARRDARTHAGRLVTLDEQDRTRWRADEVAEGLAIVDALPPTDGYAEELRLQACIAAEHGRAATAADTRWDRIASCYEALDERTGSPVVRLNRVVAVAEAAGPLAGLALLDTLDTSRIDDHRPAVVRAELARRAGQVEVARASYLQALGRCDNDVEHDHLTRRLASLGD